MRGRIEPAGITHKNLERGDQTRPIGRGIGTFVDIGGVAMGRAVLEPGWRWSEDVKPMVGTRMCEVHHLQLILAGQFGVQMEGGEEQQFGPNDVLDIPPGHDTWVIGDEPVVLVDLSGNSGDFALPVSQARTVLTMLMTDIVGSTRTAAEIGDAAWKQRLGAHNRIVRQQLERHQGREIDTTGDGFLATFAAPSRAIACACAVRDAVHQIGIDVRVGLHTGECELMGDDVGGVAVHTGARVATLAGPGEVLVSSTVKDLVAGSRIGFDDRGTHELRGVPGDWRLYAVSV